jgi:RNA polymerase sigma-70 factor (ECF subfamily)
MHERVERLAHGVVSRDDALEREFEVQLTASSTLAFRIAYSVLRHREDAEDVAQEAFARAYRRFHQLRERDRFRPWLVRMTWRLALDRRRGDRRRVARELATAPDDRVTTPDLVEAEERQRLLWAAIDALPEKLRLVIVLANIDEHDLKEVAALLALPEGTVKSRLFEARRKLRETLQWTLGTSR